jgi:hypothetical protein
MIRYWEKGDTCGPVLICDYCGKRIQDAAVGAALTKHPFDGEIVVDDALRFDVLHVHKGPCLDAAEKLPGVKSGWNELSHHLLKLVYNVKFSPEVMQELLDQLSDSPIDFG